MLLIRNNAWLYIELSFCAVAFLACLFVVPSLFEEMNELHDFVFDSVQEFKDDMNVVWDNLMDYQHSVINVEFDLEVRRQKRTQYYQPPPVSECNCQMPNCNTPGPPGPPGQKGDDGLPGDDGVPGIDAQAPSIRHYDEILSKVAFRCQKCPAGLPGC